MAMTSIGEEERMTTDVAMAEQASEPTAQEETTEVAGPRASRRTVPGRGGLVARAWRWFGDFRRTRPFWGSLWLMLGGWAIMSLTVAPIVVVLAAGASGVAGYLLGGGMIGLGLLAMFSPAQKGVAGVLGTAFAVAAFVASNLGGFLVGTLLGVLGGTMVFGWGPKRLRRGDRKRGFGDAGTPEADG